MSTEPADARYPQAGAEGVSYGTYLKVRELIELQQVRSDPAAHDELLFIIVHQAYELWFKQILFELEAVRDALMAAELHRSLHRLSRVSRIERLLVQQVDVIESMTFQDFLDFRGVLNPASGFQSIQFREIEAISGLKEKKHLRLAETEEERARLQHRLDQPSIWDAFIVAMEEKGLEMPPDDEERRRESLLELMGRSENDLLLTVSEALVEHDELIAIWRSRHVLMVERQIGAKIGTGGSSGAGYLRGTLGSRFYPELWDIRSEYAGRGR